MKKAEKEGVVTQKVKVSSSAGQLHLCPCLHFIITRTDQTQHNALVSGEKISLSRCVDLSVPCLYLCLKVLSRLSMRPDCFRHAPGNRITWECINAFSSQSSLFHLPIPLGIL